jgi:ABC-type glycerol-3-phosphate transport system permease component
MATQSASAPGSRGSVRGSAGPAGRRTKRARAALTAYLLIGPQLLGFLIVVAIPLIGVLLLSFTDSNLLARDAHPVGLIWYIAMPLARPMLGTVAIIAFLASWNSFLEPLVFLSRTNLFTARRQITESLAQTGSR